MRSLVLNFMVCFIALMAVSFGVQIKQDFKFQENISLSSPDYQEYKIHNKSDKNQEALKRVHRLEISFNRLDEFKVSLKALHSFFHSYYLPLYNLNQIKQFYLRI